MTLLSLPKNAEQKLKAAVLAAIVAATDEYAKIMKRHYPKEDMDEGFEHTVNTILFEHFMISINYDEIDEFRRVLNEQ